MVRYLIGVLAAAAALSAQSFSFSDDFSKYTEGADAAGKWVAAANWKVIGGRMIGDSPSDRVPLIVKGAPSGVEMKIEATIMPKEPLSDGWMAFGIIIYENATNFWQFALIGPDKEYKSKLKNFFEIKQMYGSWGYTNNIVPDTKDEINGFANPWSYGTAYTLRMELTEKGIVGTARTADGTVICRSAYTFKNRNGAVSGKPGLTTAGIKGECAMFRVKIVK
ncbi:MAG: hypothetical protein HZC28_20345 [Spirochaetes bacterium]|nr:hypothetical protein [Spirochaetota bacterium]